MENTILALALRDISRQVEGSEVETVIGFAPMCFACRLRLSEDAKRSRPSDEHLREPPSQRKCLCLVVCLDRSLPVLFTLKEPETQGGADHTDTLRHTPADELPEGFVKSLAQALRGTVLTKIEQHERDRVVRIEFSKREAETAHGPSSVLWLELFGRRPVTVLAHAPHAGNLTNKSSQGSSQQTNPPLSLSSAPIIACSHEGITSAGGWLLQPREPYAPPSQGKKEDAEKLSTEFLWDLLEETPFEELPLKLSHRVKGLSPQAAALILEDVRSDTTYSAENVIRAVREALRKPEEYFSPAVRMDVAGPLLRLLPGGKRATFLPGTGEHTRGEYVHAAGYEVSYDTRQFDNALDAVRFAFFELCRHYRTLAASKLRKHARALLQKLGKLRVSLLDDLVSAEKGDAYRRTGELILAHLRSIPRGSSSVELRDIHTDGEATVRIELEPSLSPSDNAEQYFKKARKAKRAVGLLRKRIASVEHSLTTVEDFLALIPPEVDAPALHSLSKRLGQMAKRLSISSQFQPGGLSMPEDMLSPQERRAAEGARQTRMPTKLGTVAGARKGTTEGRALFAPRVFLTSDGYTVIVGRNNRENDYVTHRLAKQEDLWFHASGMPGSHVILKRKGRAAPSRRAIEETASIAAYFSKGRTSSGVPIIYTEKKYVHKPRGAKPGTATCARERFLMVAPKKPKATVEEHFEEGN